MLVLALVTNTWYYCTNQYINQRCLGAKDEWHAKMGMVFCGFLGIVLAFSVAFPGLIAYALDPNLDDPNKAYPYLVTNLLPPSLQGLVLAALVSAIMSTISSLLNSTSTVFTIDIYRRFVRPDAPAQRLIVVGRYATGCAARGSRLHGRGRNVGTHFRLLPGGLGPPRRPHRRRIPDRCLLAAGNQRRRDNYHGRFVSFDGLALHSKSMAVPPAHVCEPVRVRRRSLHRLCVADVCGKPVDAAPRISESGSNPLVSRHASPTSRPHGLRHALVYARRSLVGPPGVPVRGHLRLLLVRNMRDSSPVRLKKPAE